MENSIIKTNGMHCKSCEMLIQDALEELDGIQSAKADNTAGIVIVEFDPAKTSLELIKSAIKKQGYEVE